ncbi:NAD(P)/FAD-dependent oxidoreductase [uncultured Arthrobacter sp.]|uniref:NAD(P)/FAD-dependent oxidoreductase n=1 Tax=uncultured Arthrobacter sp. TaxID=114050 RepID=UPI0025DFB1AF|nr:NAD(P)/FAD-dependent oxidoreductase [uncultured Arthrobacter sp.]
MPTTSSHDVVILGGGLSGLSAALVLGRARRGVAVVNARGPRNAAAEAAHGFLTRDGAPPLELVAMARREAAVYGVELVDGAGVAAVSTDTGWLVELECGRTLEARHVIAATGLQDVLPDLEGAEKAWGRGLFQCPYCHGWEVRDRRLGVLGTTGSSVHQALLLRQWSPHVAFFTHTLEGLTEEDRLQLKERGVPVVEGKVKALAGGTQGLVSVELDSGAAVECEGLFCEPEARVDSALTDAFGWTLRGDGCVAVDEVGRTSVPGVWAVGNVTDPAAQLMSAAGDAYRTAVALNAVLVEEDTARP